MSDLTLSLTTVQATYPMNRWLFKTRIVSLVVLATFCIYDLIDSGAGYFRYFTQWGLLLSNIYFIASIIFPTHPKLKILFQIAWTNEGLITVIFWFILVPLYICYPDAVSNLKEDLLAIIDRIAAHLLPMVTLTLELSLSNWTLGKIDFVYSYIFMFTYCMTDGFLVMSGKKEAY